MGARKVLTKRKVFGAFFLVCSGVAHNRSFETAAAEDSNALAAVDSSPFFHTVAIATLLVEKHKWIHLSINGGGAFK